MSEQGAPTGGGRKPAAVEIYRGRDAGEIARAAAQIFLSRPNTNTLALSELRVPDGGFAGRDSVVRGARLSNLSVAQIRYGASFEHRVPAQHMYHLALIDRGEVTAYFGSRRVTMRPGMVAVTRPEEPVLIPAWGDNTKTMCVQVHPGTIEAELTALVDRPVSLPRLEGHIDLTTPAGRSWRSALKVLWREVEDPDSLLRHSRAYGAHLERLLVRALLFAVRHEHSEAIWAEVAPARWRSVKRAVDAIQAAPERDWALDELADLAGVSARRLQQGFREQMGLSPMVFLRNVRLDRVRRELLSGAENIGWVSAYWHLGHSGRFAAAYRERYGETPSETRRRARLQVV